MIEEIWIITSWGIPLFYLEVGKDQTQLPDENLDKSTLLGGFWSAINVFVKNIGADAINSVQFGAFQFVIKKSLHNLLFIAKTPLKMKDKKVKEVLDKIVKSFCERFPTAEENVDGNTDQFLPFLDVANKIILDTYATNFQNGLSAI